MARPSKNPKLKYRRVSISLPPEVEGALRSKSWETGLSMGEIVTEALKEQGTKLATAPLKSVPDSAKTPQPKRA